MMDWGFGEDRVRVPILYYHRVEENLSPKKGVSPAAFAAQMDHLQRKGYRSISFDDLADHFLSGRPLPQRPVIISFDDGYADNYTRAFPILRERGFTATIFLVSAYIGRKCEWPGCAGEDVVPLMDREEIREMAAAGFHFGAHGRFHGKLVDLPPPEARREVEGSKEELEDLLQRPVRSFAYPYGDFHEGIMEMVGQAGFTSARTVHTGNLHRREDLLRLRCVKVNGLTPWRKFKYYLTGFYHWETIWHEHRKRRRSG